MECSKCGAELDFREAFCSKCGGLTDRGKGPGELVGRYAAELANGFGKLIAAAFAYVTNPDNRKKVGIGAGVALLLLVSMTNNPISHGVGSIFDSTPDAQTLNDDGTPNFAEYEDVFIGDEKEFIVLGTANVRDFPTSQGSQVIRVLSADEIVLAREVKAFDPESLWYKLDSGGYIWSGNLDPIEQFEVQAPIGPVFPISLQGEWTDISQCEGSQSGFAIRFEGDRFVELGRSGTLTSAATGANGNSVYRLNMVDDIGSRYAGAIGITFNADRTAILVDDLNMEVDVPRWWYRDNVPCGERNEFRPQAP